MDTIKTHSYRVLEKTFEVLTKEDLEMIRILLSRLSLIREYKNNLTPIYINGIMSKDKMKRYMVTYLAVSLLLKKDNRTSLQRFTRTDLQNYNRKLFRKMIKINDLDYTHFKNITNEY